MMELRTPPIIGPTTGEIPAIAWVPATAWTSMDTSNRGGNNRGNTCNSMGTNNSMDMHGKSMGASNSKDA